MKTEVKKLKKELKNQPQPSNDISDGDLANKQTVKNILKRLNDMEQKLNSMPNPSSSGNPTITKTISDLDAKTTSIAFSKL